MRHIESNIQKACIKWFSLQFPDLRPVMFAVGNGGYRNKIEAAIMKGEGVTAGVADVLFLYPNKQYHGLCIEFKTPTGKQTDSQKAFAKNVEKHGYKYIIARSLQEFITELKSYIYTDERLKKP